MPEIWCGIWTLNQRDIVSVCRTLNTPFQGLLQTKRTGALGETRTRTACATAPSRQRVYQFHHQSVIPVLLTLRTILLGWRLILKRRQIVIECGQRIRVFRRLE